MLFYEKRARGQRRFFSLERKYDKIKQMYLNGRRGPLFEISDYL